MLAKENGLPIVDYTCHDLDSILGLLLLLNHGSIRKTRGEGTVAIEETTNRMYHIWKAKINLKLVYRMGEAVSYKGVDGQSIQR